MRVELERLKQLLLQTVNKEQAEAKTEEINQVVERVCHLGIVPPETFIALSSYEIPAVDRNIVVKAALAMPEGFGVVRINSDEFSHEIELDAILERDSRSYFVPYAKCSAGERALIAADVNQLFDLFAQYVERWAIVSQS